MALLARIVRGRPERIFMIVRNMHSATLNHGDCVQWLVSTDALPAGYVRVLASDGIGVDVRASTAITSPVAGVISEGPSGIPQGQFGKCQVYGLHLSAKTNTAAPAIGVVFTPGAAGKLTDASVAALANITDRRCAECLITGAANVAGIFLKVMGQ